MVTSPDLSLKSIPEGLLTGVTWPKHRQLGSSFILVPGELGTDFE